MAITNDLLLLTNYYCKTFYSSLCSKTQTNSEIQQELLQPIKPKITNEINEKLIQKI